MPMMATMTRCVMPAMTRSVADVTMLHSGVVVPDHRAVRRCGVVRPCRSRGDRGDDCRRTQCQPDDTERDRPTRPAERKQSNDTHSSVTHPRDRKSTRLNSSHTVNSYAVFWSKKKIGFAHESMRR